MAKQKPFKGFNHFNQAWYASASRLPGELDRVTIGWYYKGGGCDGEFSMVWELLGGKVAPRLCMYSDSWGCFESMRELFDGLRLFDDTDMTPAQLCGLLVNLGYYDVTARESPYQDKRSELAKSAKAKLTPEEYAAIASPPAR